MTRHNAANNTPSLQRRLEPIAPVGISPTGRCYTDTRYGTQPTLGRRITGHWGRIILPNETETRILRVVTLDDGQTLHNAFIDRNYREDTP